MKTKKKTTKTKAVAPAGDTSNQPQSIAESHRIDGAARLVNGLRTARGAKVRFDEIDGELKPLIFIESEHKTIVLTLAAFHDVYRGLCKCWGPVKQLEKCARQYNQALRLNQGKAPAEIFEMLGARFPDVPLSGLKKSAGNKVKLDS